MRRHLLLTKCDACRAAFFAERMTVAEMHRDLTLQVRQRECGLPIASVSCAKQREERLVLIDWQELAIALRPALWRIVETHDLYFRQKWL